MHIIWMIGLLATINGLKIGPEEFLVKYGYLSSKHTFGDLSAAVQMFQKFAHLPVTGILDHDTVAMMQKPRCGVQDVAPSQNTRSKRFVASTSYWQHRTVTYAFENYNTDLGQARTRRIIAAAFKTWSDVTNLVFKEVTGTKGTINIRFGSGGHKCYYPFDGQGGVLAHAFYPDNGQVHFDEDEDYTEGTDSGTNLFWVAAHEFGHALGLPHSDVYEALMYPFYKGYKADFKLPLDDTGAIQALYGCKNTAFPGLSIPTAGQPYKGMLMQRWANAEGDAMHHIEPNVCRYPHQPDSIKILSTFEAPMNNGDNIATRIMGYYEAKQSGYHEFELCADHSAKLFVSSSSSPADKQEIIKVEKPTNKDFGKCKSAYASSFKAGESYYVEAIHKESSGDDFIKVGIRIPNGKMSLMTAKDLKWTLTDTNLRKIICKGRYEALICPQNHVIEVTKAAYGYFSRNSDFTNKVKSLCNVQRSNSRDDCAAPSSKQVVTSSCQGKQQCILYAHDSVFSDECSRWQYSILDVTYQCVLKGSITSPPITTGPVVTQAPVTTQQPVTDGTPCKDKSNSCPSWKDGGHCSYKHIKEYWCPKTCGYCTSGNKPTIAPTTSSPCTDHTSTAHNCQAWKDAGLCQTTESLRKTWCRKTCNTC